MTDLIKVQRIAVYAFHGVMEEEAKLGQKFFISLTVEADLSKAGTTDNLDYTINYAKLTELAIHIATQQRFQLVEALAEAIATQVLDAFPLAHSIGVEIEKPSAPIQATFDTVSVTIFRKRTGS
ncbi:dihydroneopterin aldolase [Microvirga sp. W0021]|uniref:7,8-dihydroneopterin aldolase n=1 Tax=Hohaiivirga grylli TaxID=3133970 RepID=A0ABV0BIS2_9HYPH